MGITGEMVRSVFSRNRSVGTQESTARRNAGDKRRWPAVRLYLCGDEFNSVLAEEDSASIKSSEATVTQPIVEDHADIQSEESKEYMPKEKHNSTSKLFQQDDAAIIIQLAFRKFLARRRSEETKPKNVEQDLALGMGSPSRDSVGTSVEVQTGNSVEVLSVTEARVAVHPRIHKKARTQVLKLKEDWDDSTVSSNISQMRIKNRLEATNRRERALAYAFSQQLRICSKKKQTKVAGAHPNMSWNWLERWMATRVPERSVESCTGMQLEPIIKNQGIAAGKGFLDIAVEEQESCGSNEVSVQLDSISAIAANQEASFKSTRNRSKATRNISRRKTVPSYQCPKDHTKASKKENSIQNGQDKELQPKQPVCKE
ncbi:hypothetical protein Tsubulata_032229 [Turnera subulata]|uniref:Protein IQ-DOMAIN 1 n=1 Tax=Turnera subulata TaxID=218843 RepID=A0A9Q0GEA3_9ROSI|nr:hypothetical protein Tsubulata_032229 [Turnera subulata]